MIGAWMLYSIVVTGLVAIAGNFAESACLLARRSTRTVWIAVLVSAVTIPIFALTRSDLPVASVGSVKQLSSISGTLVQRGAAPAVLQFFSRSQTSGLFTRVTEIFAPFDTVLLWAWAIGGCLWLTIVIVSASRVRRELSRWNESVLDGVRVWVSDDIGPALAGLFSYRIVVPAWVANLTSGERALVIEHEREHARAHDPTLIALSAFLVVLLPWNVGLWYVQRRLRIAIELDCDTRVLRKLPDVSAYGSLLINIGERNLSQHARLAAFAEPRSSLERRIKVMASSAPKRPIVRTLLFVGAASVLLIGACRAPKPTNTISPADRVRSLSLELAALLRGHPALSTNIVAPELYQALDSTLAARHARDTITPRKNPEFGATMSTARLLRRLDSATRRMESRSDSLERQTPNMPAYIDTLRSLAERLEPAAFDSMSMPSSAAVGLVLGAHNLVLRHSLTPIAARGDMYAAYDNVVGRSFTISGGLTERLFPGLDLQREIQGITIARVAGKEGGRRTVVIAVRTQ